MFKTVFCSILDDERKVVITVYSIVVTISQFGMLSKTKGESLDGCSLRTVEDHYLPLLYFIN